MPNVLPQFLQDLVHANRILYRRGVVDGFGHVSVRHPDNPEHFLMARSMAPGLVTADDVMTLDLSGEPVRTDMRPNLERYIHSAIYAARPDVISVVHNHSQGVIPFGLVPTAPLRPVCHLGGFIGDAAPVFEIREAGGAKTDMLVRTPALGVALAEKLANANVILMRGHGATIVGLTLRQAVFRSVYTEVNARLQAEALKLGTPVYMNADEAEAASTTNDGQIDRSWDLWLRELG